LRLLGGKSRGEEDAAGFVQANLTPDTGSGNVSVKAESDGDSEIQDQDVEIAEPNSSTDPLPIEEPQSKLGDEDDSTSEVQSESEKDEEDIEEAEQNSSDQNDSASDVEIKSLQGVGKEGLKIETFPIQAEQLRYGYFTSYLFGTFALEIELVISEEDVVPFIWFSCFLRA